MNKEIFSYVDVQATVNAENGPLAGKSIAIQPNMSVAGWPTEAGSTALERYVALEDATVVERLRANGAKIAGSTRMSELGFGLKGDTAARAVSDGNVDIALVTDTMGEARVTAATANLFGFKPSYGIVSRFGLIGLVPSMECYGVVARTPGEIAAVMNAIAGADERDFSMPGDPVPDFGRAKTTPDGPTRLGVILDSIASLEPSDSDAFKAALSKLREAGFHIDEVSLQDYDLFGIVHNVIGSVEASSSGGKYDGVRYGHRALSCKNWNEMYLRSRAESFGVLVKSYLFQGAYFQFENYPAFENACRIRARLVKQMESICEKVDLIVCPMRQKGTDVGAMDTVDAVYRVFATTLPANITGQPALHVPGSLLGRETDPGLQFVAPRLGDQCLLSVAADLLKISEGDI